MKTISTPKFLPFVVKSMTVLSTFGLCSSAFALDQIVRPYQSVRSAGMGGVRITTGLYDENFFNNPARVTANPESKLTLMQITPIETTSTTLDTLSSFSNNTGSNGPINSISQATGKNLHARIQMVLPAFYLASSENRKWALAIGLIGGMQVDAIVQKSYQLGLAGFADIGPAVTFGHKFLKDDALSVGITGHYTYRYATNPNFNMVDFISGTSISSDSILGGGSSIDFDLGSTYQLTQLGDFNISLGGAIQNIRGGSYTNSPLQSGQLPSAQPRSYGLGVSASRQVWSYFTDSLFAFEITDVLNNRNGSLFKLLHLGGETHWKRLAIRLGVNQGYLTAGLGLNFHYFTLDLATYGEEMGLNAGTLQDRRFTLNFGFHI